MERRARKMSMPSLTTETVTTLCDMAGITGQSRTALQLIYVDGLTAYAAAQQLAMQQSTISRARARLLALIENGNRLAWPIRA